MWATLYSVVAGIGAVVGTLGGHIGEIEDSALAQLHVLESSLSQQADITPVVTEADTDEISDSQILPESNEEPVSDSLAAELEAAYYGNLYAEDFYLWEEKMADSLGVNLISFPESDQSQSEQLIAQSEDNPFTAPEGSPFESDVKQPERTAETVYILSDTEFYTEMARFTQDAMAAINVGNSEPAEEEIAADTQVETEESPVEIAADTQVETEEVVSPEQDNQQEIAEQLQPEEEAQQPEEKTESSLASDQTVLPTLDNAVETDAQTQEQSVPSDNQIAAKTMPESEDSATEDSVDDSYSVESIVNSSDDDTPVIDDTTVIETTPVEENNSTVDSSSAQTEFSAEGWIPSQTPVNNDGEIDGSDSGVSVERKPHPLDAFFNEFSKNIADEVLQETYGTK